MDIFWGSTLLELSDIIESRKRMEEAEEKQNIARAFVLAEAISTRIGFILTDSKSRTEDLILQPWDAYPRLFTEEKKEIEMRKEKSELEDQKLRILDRAARVNAFRHGKEAAE